MIHNECRENGAAPHHGAGSETGIDGGPFLVSDGARFLIERGELDGSHDVQDHRDQQHSAGEPQQSRLHAQKAAVGVKLFASEEDLEISGHVNQDEAEEDHSGDGHDGLLANGRVPKVQGLVYWAVDSCRSHSKPPARAVASADSQLFREAGRGEGPQARGANSLLISPKFQYIKVAPVNTGSEQSLNIHAAAGGAGIRAGSSYAFKGSPGKIIA